MERLDKPEKHWKFSAADVRERELLGRLHARVRGSDPGHRGEAAPWFVVPADNKWFTRLIVAAAIVEAVEKLELSYPKIDAAKKKELGAARSLLARENGGAGWSAQATCEESFR